MDRFHVYPQSSQDRLSRPGHMTRGAFGDHRRSIFNRTRITLYECLDQHRRLTEVLFWLAVFVPKLRNNELVNCITFRHRYAHHDTAARTKHGNFLGRCQQVSQVRQPLGMCLQFWNGYGRILVVRGGYKQIDPKIRAAAFFEGPAAGVELTWEPAWKNWFTSHNNPKYWRLFAKFESDHHAFTHLIKRISPKSSLKPYRL